MGWWFGRKAAPKPVRPLVPAWLSAAGGEGFVRSYEAQVDEVYRNNPVGQRAVRLLSGLLGSVARSSPMSKAPLDCSVERYRVTLRGSATTLELATTAPGVEVAPTQVTSLGSGAVEVSVVQVGDLAVSRPASGTVTLD